MTANESLGLEWTTLQNNHEQYEKGGLLLKLASLVLTAMGIALGLDAWLIAALVAVLWAQEGIYRTFQSRLGERILRVESLIRQDASGAGLSGAGPLGSGLAYQLHSEWLAGRKGGLALVAEYARSASRPTVAFPHALILLGFMIAYQG